MRRNENISRALFIGSLAGLLFFMALFSIFFAIASMRPMSTVSLCYCFRPWYRPASIIFPLAPALFGGCFVGLLIKVEERRFTADKSVQRE